MYLLLSRSKYTEGNSSWYDGFISTISESGESLCCKEIAFTSWAEMLGVFELGNNYTVEQKDEDHFIVRENLELINQKEFAE